MATANAKKTPQPQSDAAVSDQVNGTETPSEAEPMPAPLAGELTQEPRYRITARHPNGFWRCGRKWLAQGEELSLSEIGGGAVLAVLRDEPMLVVHQLGGE